MHTTVLCQAIKVLEGQSNVFDVAISADGGRIVSGSYYRVGVWNMESGQVPALSLMRL